MDSLTHIVFGAVLGEALLGNKIGKKSLLLGAMANSIPDFDVFFTFGDPIREITIHRGFSHSFVFPFLASPILAWLAKKFLKDPVHFKVWFWFFFWLILTHPLLDCLTTYGTQFFLPFSDFRVNFSSLFIIDLWFTFPLLICTLTLWVLKKEYTHRRILSIFSLAISSLYVLAGFSCKAYASFVFRQQLEKQKIQTTHTMTGVTPFNILLWYTIAEVDSGYFVGDYSILDRKKDIEFSFIKRNEQLLQDIEKDYEVNRLIWFSNGFYAVEKVNDKIWFFTLKFGPTSFDLKKPLSQSVPFYYALRKEKNGKYSKKR